MQVATLQAENSKDTEELNFLKKLALSLPFPTNSTVRIQYCRLVDRIVQRTKHIESLQKPRSISKPKKRQKLTRNSGHSQNNRPPFRELPRYIQRNLRNMPSNKGYVYRGNDFYGQQPPEQVKFSVLFEQIGPDVLRIHEIYSTKRIIYEKHGKNRRKQIQTIQTS